MEKPTIPKTYLLQDNRVEILPYFLYEVSVYKITKNMVALMGSQFYKSNQLLTIKEDVTVKKYKDYSVVRYVDILGVTKEFMEENHLPIYEAQVKKKTIKKKKNERTR